MLFRTKQQKRTCTYGIEERSERVNTYEFRGIIWFFRTASATNTNAHASYT